MTYACKTVTLVKRNHKLKLFNKYCSHTGAHAIPPACASETAAEKRYSANLSDGGRNWKNIYRYYIRAIWVDPTNAQHIIAGPADGVSRNGRIEESYDGGQTWHLASDGMMSAPWSRHMVERFVQLDNDLFAVLSNGELWLKRLDGFPYS